MILKLSIINAQDTTKSVTYSIDTYLHLADSLYSRGSYYTAIDFLEQAYSINPELAYISYKLGWAYYKSRNYEKAEIYFREAFELAPRSFPDAQYFYAQMLKRNGRYSLAIDEFVKLKSQYKGPNKDQIKSWSRKEIESCDYALDQKRLKSAFEINHLNNNINSYYSDIAPIMYDSSLLIYSALKTDSIINDESKNRFFQLYQSHYKKDIWQPSVPFDFLEFTKDKHIANLAFNKSKNTMFFSMCDYIGLGKAKCSIYRSRYNPMEEAWNSPKKLNTLINLKTSTNTQVCIGNYKDGQEVLYFVSDREGGVGGLDIWYSIIDENGKFETPKNCGKRINTDRDEMTPFYDNSSNTLYFSSEGHLNFGGFDIFYAIGMAKKWQYPINVGYGLNTSNDELYFYLNSDGKTGLFSSNRQGSLTLKHPTCCDDVYTFEKIKIIKLLVTGNMKLPADSFPEIQDSIQWQISFTDSIGRDPIPLSQKSLTDKIYQIEVKENQCYTIKTYAEQDSFIYKGKKTFCTYGFDESTNITHDITFDVIKRSKRYNRDEIEFNKPYPLINAISFNKFKLDKKSKEGLIDLYNFLNENSDLKIQIVSHTDSKGAESYNQKLSQKRAESVVRFLVSRGISKKRLSALGKGESEPIAPNTLANGQDNPTGREKNRRTDFIITGRIK